MGITGLVHGLYPSIGFIIALIPPVLMAYVQYGLQTALVVLLGYILINGGVQNFIQPKIMGQGLKISPVVCSLAYSCGVSCWEASAQLLSGADDAACADDHGEFRRHAHAGGADALHG